MVSSIALAASTGLNIPLETAIPYVAGAYILVWVIFFGYLLFLGGRIKNLNNQVQALSAAVEAKANKAKSVQTTSS